MTLKTIEEHNAWKRALIEEKQKRRSGIACPTCNEELSFEDDLFLMSNPPKRRVNCMSCGYRDFVLA